MWSRRKKGKDVYMPVGDYVNQVSQQLERSKIEDAAKRVENGNI